MRYYILPCLIAILFFHQPVLAQDFDDLNNQAFKERDNKNYQRAIELCTQAISKKVNSRSFIIRADCKYELKKYQPAIDDFESALTYYDEYYSDNKEKAGIFYMMGRCKHELERYIAAISDYNSALKYNYDEPGYVYWNRGASYYESGQYKEADDDYTKAIEKISASDDLSILYSNRGDCQANLGEFDKSYSNYEIAIRYNKNNYNPYWQRGHYKGREYKYEEALADFDRAIEILLADPVPAANNNLAILYRNKALMHKNLKQFDVALAAINKSAATDPNMSKTYRVRGDIYQAMKKYDKAKADYESAVTLQPDEKIKADIYLDRSIMEWNMLDYKSCLGDLNKGIAADPSNGMLFWNRARLYGYKKNYPAAIKECNTAMELYKTDSSSTASLIWQRAIYKDYSGDYKGAAGDFQTYLKYYPKSYYSYYELGRIFKWRLKNNDLANANLDKAVELAEKAKDTSIQAFIALLRGNKEEAYKKMMEHIEANKHDEYQYKWELHNMACMYALAGNTPKAFEYLDKSLKAGFDDYLHLVNDRDLVTLMNLPQWKTILAKYKVPAPKY